MTWNPSLIDGPIEVVGAGYHLNIAPECMAPVLEPYRVTPATPNRVFAGGDTAFLRFANEAEARLMLGAYWIEDDFP